MGSIEGSKSRGGVIGRLNKALAARRRWAGMLASAWQMVVKRILAHWKILSSVMAGVVLASAILSGTVIYFDALRALSLDKSLAGQTDRGLDMLVRSSSIGKYQAVTDAVTGAIDEHAAWLGDVSIHAVKTATFFLGETGAAADAGQDDKRAYFAFVPALDSFVSLLPDGRMPAVARHAGGREVPDVEAIIPEEAAKLFDVGPGDRLIAVPTQRVAAPHVNVLITGVFRRNDPVDESFAYIEREVLESATGPEFRTIPFHVPLESITGALNSAFPRAENTYVWLLDTDVTRLNASNAREALFRLNAMDRGLVTSLPSYARITRLDNALVEFERRLFFSKLPMFVVLVLIAVVILYYVATLSSLVVDSRRAEVALLRSRGASPAQILAVFVLEGGIIALVAVAVAPFLAAASVSLMGLSPAFSDLTDGKVLTVGITISAFLLSLLGGVLSFVALIIPAVQASRIDLTRQRQQAARPTALPVFQRYYFDVLLLLIGIVLFRQLSEQGSVVAVDLVGQQAVDQLLLAVPAVVLVASAMVLLRLFPLAMRMISRISSPWLPAGLVMAVWQIAREPTHYARLSLLLILTAGLGIFASSFGATLERSFRDRILYSTGSDITLESVRAVSQRDTSGIDGGSAETLPHSALESAYRRVPGVTGVSAVMRSPGRDLTMSTGGSYEMFAVDSEAFADVAYFRGDFSDRSIRELMESLKFANPPQGIELPNDATTIGALVRADKLHPTVRVVARIRDAGNRHFNYSLGTLRSGDWLALEADLELGTANATLSSRPLTLVSLGVEETAAAGIERQLQPGSLLIDEITVKTEGGETRLVEAFDTLTAGDDAGNVTQKWHPLRTDADSMSDELQEAGSLLEQGAGAVLFSWSSGDPLTTRGIFPGRKLTPLPVVASEGFMRDTGHSLGEEFDVEVSGARVPVTLVAKTKLFPTLKPPEKKYLIADLDALTLYANLGADQSQRLRVDLWLAVAEDGTTREALLESLKNVEGFRSAGIGDRARLLAESKVDPLIEAGWRALLFISFATVLVLSCAGFLIHSYVSFRNRQIQFALMQTTGFSKAQLVSTVWLEQMLVIAVGMGLGTWMGGTLGAAVMPFLGHDDFGGKVVPPFVIEIDWGALLLTYAAMLAVFAIIGLALVWFIQRIKLRDVLRFGER